MASFGSHRIARQAVYAFNVCEVKSTWDVLIEHIQNSQQKGGFARQTIERLFYIFSSKLCGALCVLCKKIFADCPQTSPSIQPVHLILLSWLIIACGWQTHVAVLLMLTVLTALWIVLAIVDSQHRHAQRRRQWFALLFAPFGALLRWKLALLNGRMPRWKWFPVGTLAANLIACCIDFGTQVQ